MDKRIIINADDFGLCDRVNKAVAQAHTDGVLTSATIMANMPAAGEAVKTAKKLPDLSVGVHLNLSEGRAVSKDSCIDCLLNVDGCFAFSPFKRQFYPLADIKSEMPYELSWPPKSNG